MYIIRQWSVTHSRKLEALYRNFEPVLMRLHPLFKAVGYGRLETPVRVVDPSARARRVAVVDPFPSSKGKTVAYMA